MAFRRGVWAAVALGIAAAIVFAVPARRRREVHARGGGGRLRMGVGRLRGGGARDTTGGALPCTHLERSRGGVLDVVPPAARRARGGGDLRERAQGRGPGRRVGRDR